MDRFRRGETLDIKLVIRNQVGVNDIHIFFVHEEDDNAHIYWGVQGKEGKDKVLPPSLETSVRWEKTISEDQKLGVYTLQNINFKTFEGTTLGAPFPTDAMKFEVVQDLKESVTAPEATILMEEVDAPIVIQELSITASQR